MVETRFDFEVGANVRGAIAAFKRLNRSTENFTSRLKKVGTGFVSLGAGVSGWVSITSGAFRSVKGIFDSTVGVMLSEASKFTTSMTQVWTLMGDNTEQAFGRMKGQVLELSTRLPAAADKLSKGLFDIVSATGDVDGAMKILEATTKLAIAGNTDAAIATEGVVRILEAFGDEVNGASDASDALFKIMEGGITTIEDLAPAIGKPAGTAAQLGVSLSELGGSLAILTKQFPSASTAGEALSTMMVGLAAPTETTKKALDAVGISLTDASGKFVGIRETVRRFREAGIEDLSAVQSVFADKLGASALSTLIAKDAIGDLDKAMDTVNDRAGATDKAFEKVKTTMKFWTDLIRSTVLATLTKLGASLEEDIVAGLKGVAEWTQRAFKSVVKFTKGVTFQNIKQGVQDFLDTVVAVADFISEVFEPVIGGAFKSLGRILGSFFLESGDNTKTFQTIAIRAVSALARTFETVRAVIEGVVIVVRQAWLRIKEIFTLGLADTAKDQEKLRKQWDANAKAFDKTIDSIDQAERKSLLELRLNTKERKKLLEEREKAVADWARETIRQTGKMSEEVERALKDAGISIKDFAEEMLGAKDATQEWALAQTKWEQEFSDITPISDKVTKSIEKVAKVTDKAAKSGGRAAKSFKKVKDAFSDIVKEASAFVAELRKVDEVEESIIAKAKRLAAALGGIGTGAENASGGLEKLATIPINRIFRERFPEIAGAQITRDQLEAFIRGETIGVQKLPGPGPGPGPRGGGGLGAVFGGEAAQLPAALLPTGGGLAPVGRSVFGIQTRELKIFGSEIERTADIQARTIDQTFQKEKEAIQKTRGLRGKERKRQIEALRKWRKQQKQSLLDNVKDQIRASDDPRLRQIKERILREDKQRIDDLRKKRFKTQEELDELAAIDKKDAEEKAKREDKETKKTDRQDSIKIITDAQKELEKQSKKSGKAAEDAGDKGKEAMEKVGVPTGDLSDQMSDAEDAKESLEENIAEAGPAMADDLGDVGDAAGDIGDQLDNAKTSADDAKKAVEDFQIAAPPDRPGGQAGAGGGGGGGGLQLPTLAGDKRLQDAVSFGTRQGVRDGMKDARKDAKSEEAGEEFDLSKLAGGLATRQFVRDLGAGLITTAGRKAADTLQAGRVLGGDGASILSSMAAPGGRALNVNISQIGGQSVPSGGAPGGGFAGLGGGGGARGFAGISGGGGGGGDAQAAFSQLGTFIDSMFLNPMLSPKGATNFINKLIGQAFKGRTTEQAAQAAETFATAQGFGGLAGQLGGFIREAGSRSAAQQQISQALGGTAGPEEFQQALFGLLGGGGGGGGGARAGAPRGGFGFTGGTRSAFAQLGVQRGTRFERTGRMGVTRQQRAEQRLAEQFAASPAGMAQAAMEGGGGESLEEQRRRAGRRLFGGRASAFDPGQAQSMLAEARASAAVRRGEGGLTRRVEVDPQEQIRRSIATLEAALGPQMEALEEARRGGFTEAESRIGAARDRTLAEIQRFRAMLGIGGGGVAGVPSGPGLDGLRTRGSSRDNPLFVELVGGRMGDTRIEVNQNIGTVAQEADIEQLSTDMGTKIQMMSASTLPTTI